MALSVSRPFTKKRWKARYSHCNAKLFSSGRKFTCSWEYFKTRKLMIFKKTSHVLYLPQVPRAGSGVERIDLLRFLAGCHKRRLNQALSVLSLSLGFLSVSAVLLTRAPFCVCIILCYLWVLSHVLVRLSVGALLVQVIDWKDSSPKWPIMCW